MCSKRRTIFLCVCSVVFFQALYYIVTLQIKQTQITLEESSISLITINLQNQSSDGRSAYNQSGQSNLTISDPIKTNITHEIISTNTSVNLTSKIPVINVTVTAITSTSTITTTSTTNQATSILPVIPFENASSYPFFNSTLPELRANNILPVCNFSISNNDTSHYIVKVNQTLYPYNTIEQYVGNVLYSGGHYIPKDCRPEQRLALIICYRKREQHLKMFLDNIHPFLQKQQLDYTIFIVNQDGADQFNRAALFNVGYLEAVKLYPFDCFIFHDVDLLPEDLRNVYKCGDQPRHMSVAVDKFNYKLLYSTLFGGVTAFRLSDFVGANGYPTVYWGWGGEDDDMYLRVVKQLKKSITRYPIEIARYKMIRTHDHKSEKENPHRHTILYSKYDYSLDGINTTNYTLNGVVFYKLFTLINVTLTQEPFEQIRKRLHIKKK
ncbi:hypothetical protein I4U23_019447 [Adineta vaga]|nr:hypothetical protein I4U23_019447 [Adineta vaga]